ncbi:hypothetical protein [Pseudorhodobacter ferrugineus]|uniref:hypothetical protein n=1 Tax=Pseudorhodobacter ferrugineus TaxID=77008 RepID=UPI000A9B14BD|nr:hypothetical protein [Pseudorhodobacter ferrugineus]
MARGRRLLFKQDGHRIADTQILAQPIVRRHEVDHSQFAIIFLSFFPLRHLSRSGSPISVLSMENGGWFPSMSAFTARSFG